MPVDWDKIERLRVKKGWTQEQAAKAAALKSRQHWNNLIRSRKDASVNLATLENIAEAFGCPLADLVVPKKKRK